jgi:hypothetical protein
MTNIITEYAVQFDDTPDWPLHCGNGSVGQRSAQYLAETHTGGPSRVVQRTVVLTEWEPLNNES